MRDAKTLHQAKGEAGQASPHCSVTGSCPLSKHEPGAGGTCWIRAPTPHEAPLKPTLSLLLAGGSALRRLHHLLAKSCLICTGEGEQGCPAYQRSADYQELISLLGDKRHLAEGF